MSTHDFIVDNIRFSYSSASTFSTCPYSWKLTYLDALPRENNFYAEFGTLVHECFEKFFNKELEAFELSNHYATRYSEIVKSNPSTVGFALTEKYKEQGFNFFNNFSFELNKYDVILVEGKIEFDLNGAMFVAKPDLVLRDKETKKNILYDYKTSAPIRIDKRTNKEIVDKSKIEGYYKQMYTYTYALREHMSTPIDSIRLLFPRLDRIIETPWSKEKEDSSIEWISDIIGNIKSSEEFPYNNSNNYFCNNLCSVRKFCEYK